jgi:hypothetical protein
MPSKPPRPFPRPTVRGVMWAVAILGAIALMHDAKAPIAPASLGELVLPSLLVAAVLTLRRPD